jgi:uncharacterized protein YkwD
MVRDSTALLLVLACLGGCGSDSMPDAADGPPAAAERQASGVTEGELGDATVVSAKAPLRQLSPGGKPDLSPRPARPGGAGVDAGAACEGGDLDPTAANLAAVAAATLCRLNAERAAQGLGPLRANADLAEAATAHARDMVDRKYFAHVTPDGVVLRSRVLPTGYLEAATDWMLGENIAWGSGALARPKAVVLAWMNSPGHRENILQGRYEEIGFGLVLGKPSPSGTGGLTYVNVFGTVTRGGGGTVAAPPPPSSTSSASKRAAARRRCAKRRTASSRRRCRAALRARR